VKHIFGPVPHGDWATIACGWMITKLVRSTTLAEAQHITSNDLISELDGIP
jgi:hypothetical protein